MHDGHREEIEIKFNRNEFEKLEKLLLCLGFEVEIKWFRKRFKFQWGDIAVCLDRTKGYGHIIELEKMSSGKNKEKELEGLRQKLKSLNVEITPKEEFDRKFLNYKKNWKSLIGNASEN